MLHYAYGTDWMCGMRGAARHKKSNGGYQEQPRVERFHRLFGSMTDAAFLVETDTGRILACNDAAEAQTGYTKSELIGKDIGGDLQIQDPTITSHTVINQVAAGEGLRFIDKKRRKDGTCYWDEVVLVPFRTEAESVHVSINRDISDRARQETELRESEVRYRSIFESTTDAVLIFNQEGNIVEANPNAYSMYGYEPGELIGIPASQVIHPDYFHGFANFRTAIDRTGRFRARSINLRKDGTPFDVEVHGGRFSFQGSAHLLSIVRDIREQIAAERELELARSKVERLHEAASRLANSESVDEICHLAVEAARDFLDFNLCIILLVENGKLVVQARSEGWPPSALNASDLEERSVASNTFRAGRTIVFGSATEVPEARPALEGFQSGISAPIGSFGVFQVVAEETNAFSDQDVRLLELLLRHTSQAIERIHLQEVLLMQANHDPLTGVYNRRYFNQVIEQELARSKRHARSIGFLMIDVNRFKEINDRFGHQMGDEVLKAVASLLKDAVRESDLVIRYGGDEFLIVLMEPEGDCQIVKNRIAAAVAERNRTNALIQFPVTLAIGGAIWKAADSLPIEEVLAQADRRMYSAKRELEDA